MDEQRRPRSREKRVVSEGKGVEKRGEGLGTGPVNNTGNYESRRRQQSKPQVTHNSGAQNPFSYTQGRPEREPGQTKTGGSPFTQHRPGQTPPFGHPSAGGNANTPFGFGGIPQQNNTAQKPQQGFSGSTGSRQYNHAVKQNGQNTQRTGGTGSGGGKMLLIIVALVVLLGGGGLSGLFGGGNEPVSNVVSQPVAQQTTGTGTQQSSGGLGGLSDLLGSLLGSSSTTAYDFTSAGSFLQGQNGSAAGNYNQGTQYFTSSSDDNSTSLNENVSGKAREKYTRIIGGQKDQMTILVYMCGTDLESQQGMASSDLKEMAAASFGQNVNLIIYTGGCNRWRNNVVSSSVNQIYQIRDGGFYCLEKDMGRSSMVSPDTLAGFIEYGKKNFPANRMCLIFWDHGGGSVSGFGYDEKVGHNQSMTLAGINSALKKADVRFDFIGFDACLMATVENGIMLSQYADYMIASEETEPGVGWYYTNWLTELGKNTSMPTTRIGQRIADDFVEVCNRQCRGQATTLSVVDLAELQGTIPEELKQFSIDTNELIKNKEYKAVSSARSKTREFAQQSRIDQIDLVDFAKNMNTAEGKSLAKALQSCVKYNRTGGSITHAYGLSIYFPYKRVNKVNQMVSTYQAIGMDEEYTRCIQEFASLEVSGQVSAGTPVSGYGLSQSAGQGLFESLMGQNGYSSSSYSGGGLADLLGGLYGNNGGGSTGSILDLFTGRSLTARDAADYIQANHFDPTLLKWEDSRITLPGEQWDLVYSIVRNVFIDDGEGYLDLGCDPEFDFRGNTLTGEFDGTWLSIDRQPVAYYYLNTVDDGDQYVIYGYVPALLNGERVNLILNFDSERPEGYIAGAQKVYPDKESDTQAKTLIAIGEGDQLQFLCDYYDYEENYTDTYHLGQPITLGKTVEIANTPIQKDRSKCKVTYRLTDLYQKEYWTPALP